MTTAKMDNALREAVEAGTPVEVVDPQTQRVYYVVSAEQFQRMVVNFSDDFNPGELYPIIDRVMAEDDANDPLLETYQ